VIHHFGKVDLDREEAKKRFYLHLAEVDLAEDPDNPTKLFNLLSQAYIAGHWEVVIDAAYRYITIRHEAPIPVALMAAMARQHLGMHEEAISYLEAILKPFPDNVLALNRMAISLMSVGKIDEAMYYINKAIELNPDFDNSKAVLAKIISRIRSE
jgi:tetratricopeptide (TPR) repeat protein